MPTTTQVWWDNAIKLIVGLIVLLGAGGLIWLVLHGSISGEMKDILLLVIGFLTSNANTVVQYYFGSSSGSAQKTAAGIAAPPPPPARTP